MCQPFSRVFRRLWETCPAPVNNNQRNVAANKDPRHFLAEERADLLFLRLPRALRNGARRTSLAAWREEWVRGTDEFWPDFERARAAVGRSADGITGRGRGGRVRGPTLRAEVDR